MNLEEFQKLPIGTVLLYENGGSQIIEVKKSKNIVITVDNLLSVSWVGEMFNIKSYQEFLEHITVAPKWVSDKFTVE